uniref:hypothetical protein n=1 Tax=Gordonia paraffinivorans TaxID=175628 RepID=UPI001B3564D4
MAPNPMSLREQADTPMPVSRGWLPILVVVLAVALATISALVLIGTPTANAERGCQMVCVSPVLISERKIYEHGVRRQ